MKKDLHLTASVDKPEILENIIEELATRHKEMGYGNAVVPFSWKAIDNSFVEIFISGRVEFDYNDDVRIRIPYATCFLFGCIKEKNTGYSLNWSFSLS